MSVITKKLGQLEILTAEGISVPHCFTTRLGGVSTGHLSSLNLGLHRGDDPENVRQNFQILADALGIIPEDFVLTRQIHSDIVRKVGRADRGKHMVEGASPECDALITNESGVALVIFTADCTPILLHDPVTGAVGAAHAGWRGTAMGIAAKTVEAMVREFGCEPGNIRAAVGPNISQCCFETHRDVPDAMLDALGEEVKPFIRPTGEKYYVNLKEINALWLRRAGVTKIEISDACTACCPDRFWSHRVTQGLRGSQGAVIVCKEACR
ncbi:MAG: peptidoglycan editing factor PgeF [Oscillospiraceae bacterium]|nr:peptidoglycan editing factor PgeF [Oscillospiraceae bacterium]